MNLAAVLVYLVPGASFSLENDDYASIIWQGPGQLPTLAQCVAAWPLVQAQAAAEVSNESTLRQQAETALVTNADFLALASPTNPQNAAQLKALTRQASGLIRLVIRKLDSA